ncbi:MAG: protein-L-isoaspartate O-methyltransferase, partial [Alphaproteobacteria bacterium]|nr:protein-L-isoaspartate O-methyltransferase [Alphaproteobacteria bacterium]
MKNFSTARAAMVEGQIRPMGVIDPHILAAFGSVPRERFVPDTQQSVAYRDEDVPLGEGRFLMEPAVHARMLEAVSPVKSCRILDVGGGTGYAAAILSRLVKSVTALESSKIFLDRAVRNWESEGLTNITG